MSYSGVLPRLILPGILGIVFASFTDKHVAYKCFFLSAACLHLFSSFLYLKVKQAQDTIRLGKQHDEGGCHSAVEDNCLNGVQSTQPERMVALALSQYGYGDPRYEEVKRRAGQAAAGLGETIDPAVVAQMAVKNGSKFLS